MVRDRIGTGDTLNHFNVSAARSLLVSLNIFQGNIGFFDFNTDVVKNKGFPAMEFAIELSARFKQGEQLKALYFCGYLKK